MRNIVLPLAFGALAVGAVSANAGQVSDSFETRITVQAACTVAAGDIDFGSVGVISGTETASSTLSVTCTNTTPYTLSFNSASAVTSYSGAMIFGSEDVAYNAALSGTGASGNGAAQTYTINASLPAQSTPSPATYSDTQTVYVNY